MTSSHSTQKVWFITGSSLSLYQTAEDYTSTGCSIGGLGYNIAKQALERNDLVIATARSLDSIKDLESDSCKILQLDVTDDLSIVQQKAIQALEFWQRVDVLVNNAGHGILGFTEEVGSVNLLTTDLKLTCLTGLCFIGWNLGI